MSTDHVNELLVTEPYLPQSPTIESLAQSNQYLTALIQFVTFSIEMQSVEDIVWYLTKSVIGQLGFEDCIVYLVDPESSLLVQRAAYGDKNPSDKTILDPIRLRIGEGIVGRCAELKKTMLVNDLSKAENYIVDDKSRQSELAVPIVINGELIGVIDSEHSAKDFYTQHHVSTLQAIASVIASKYASLQTVQKLQQSIASLENAKRLQQALFDITELVHISADLSDFYRKLHRILADLIKADAFYICLFDNNSKTLNFPYYFDKSTGNHSPDEQHGDALDRAFAQRVISGQAPLFLSQEDISVYLNNNELQYDNSRTPPYCWMGAPLRIDNKITGTVAVKNITNQTPFSSKSLELLWYTAQQISTALKRKHDESMLQHLALHDELTGLPNRTLFIDRLMHSLEADLRREQQQTCILYLDLDRFKLVNDSYGHHIGDKLLVLVSNKIKSCLRQHDTLARLSGDEFAILLEDITDLTLVETLSTRIIEELRLPIDIERCHIATTTSIGIVHASEFSQEKRLASEMLRCADNAMYQAKRQGKGCFVFHHKLTSNSLHDILVLEQALDTALQDGQFVCYLQPIIHLTTLNIEGFETLIRWQHPEHGLVSPGDFIEVAQKSGQIIQIDKIMMDCACKLMQRWLKYSNKVPYLNINVSSSSIAAEGFLAYFQSKIAQYGIPEGVLNIEITEQALINNFEQATYALHEIQKAGQKIILDDFGTGYSSLSYLHQLPIDMVKIDRSFVRTIGQSHTAKSIVKAVLSLADSLNIQVVIEGIEEATQRDKAIALGGVYGQGFLFHKPMSITKAEALLDFAVGDQT
ncbi:MAG: EAL domain-containing protein [Alteromonadaceae bacterium]|nr:EAL domain-containing protein [Alteromonadaceae bacterium]